MRDNRDGFTFVEVSRTKEERKSVEPGYFDKLAPEFPGYEFRTESHIGYWRKHGGEWRTLCYFVALTEQQSLKKTTFANVKRIIFDEAIIERADRYHDYLPREWYLLANLINTVARQSPGQRAIVRVYLLANACDLVNPYFRMLGIKEQPPYGFTWYSLGKQRKRALVYNEEPPEGWSADMESDTLSGAMLAASGDSGVALDNSFDAQAPEWIIASKPAQARFEYGLRYDRREYGVWVDWENGGFYVTDGAPKKSGKPTYVLKLEDAVVNALVLKSTAKPLAALADGIRQGFAFFESEDVYRSMRDLLNDVGLH